MLKTPEITAEKERQLKMCLSAIKDNYVAKNRQPLHPLNDINVSSPTFCISAKCFLK